MEKKNITVLLPVHKLDESYKEMLSMAIDSMDTFYNDVKVSIICPANIKNEISEIDFGQKLEINYVVNLGKTDFCSQINKGIETCDTEWFTILEVDDVFKPIWLKSMNEHINTYTDVDVFLPIIKDIDKEGKFLSFTNESSWAYGFTDQQGFIDNGTLLEFQNYQTSGGLYKTSVIKENGSLKENIKLTFGYEFLLRLTNNQVKIMTVPRVGYQHVNLREDSLFWSFENEKLTEDEVKFWIDSAKKEFFFKNKREINYVLA